MGTSLGETKDRRLFLCATVLHAEMRSRANESPGGPCLLGTDMGQRNIFLPVSPGRARTWWGFCGGTRFELGPCGTIQFSAAKAVSVGGLRLDWEALCREKEQLGSGECISFCRGTAQSTEPRLLKQLGGFRNRNRGRWLCWSAAPLIGRLGQAACQEGAPVSL